MIDDATLAQWEQLCKDATPGEWVWDGGGFQRSRPSPTKRAPNRVLWDNIVWAVADDFSGEAFVEMMDADRDFIAVARSAMPQLIQEVRRLKNIIATVGRGPG